MYEFIKIYEFARCLFDQEDLVGKGAEIMAGILKARSPRLSGISHRMRSKPAVNYKRIRRFLDRVEPHEALLRLFQEEASFVIGDPIKISRPDAWKTPHVGTMRDGQSNGLLATVVSHRLNLGRQPSIFTKAEGERVEFIVFPGKPFTANSITGAE